VPTHTAARYDRPAILLHWATALLVVAMWLIAQGWGFLPHGTPVRHNLQSLHVSLGLLLILVLAARIAWRAVLGRPAPPAEPGLTGLAARAMHLGLYALLLVVVVLGVCYRWADQTPLSLFGLFTLPDPVGFAKSQLHVIAPLHEWVANTILALAFLHAAAALFHRYALRDGVLGRMLPGAR